MPSSLEDDDATLGLSLEGDGVHPRERGVTGPMTQARAQGTLDRYVVLEQVGAGGMGVVHRAYDLKLRREVALKMLRFDRREGKGSRRAESRILREARTMAQLSHPNVLPVYDVEDMGELVYIAMEYVDGETLGRWLRRGNHTWREIVDCFREAGRGLDAAHQAGIVHRDFKPANVMLSNKGRVLVTDFGLARARASDEGDEPGSARSLGPIEPSLEVTEDGELVGTPVYMPPEQLRGRPVDARADQYAFCVALYEGLYGHRPFPQREPRMLLYVKELGNLEAPPGATVPTWLFRIIERGLRPDPAQRFGSMGELLQALGHDPAQARRRWVWVGSGAVLGAAVLGLRLAADAPEGPRCPEADALVREVWDDPAKQRLRAALEATAESYAADTADRVIATLDRYTQAWAQGHVEACAATHLRGEQSPETLDLRMACLRRDRVELQATIDVLSEPVSVETLREATTLVDALPDPSACADVEALLARGRPRDPAHAAEVELLRDDLARANALTRAGRSDEARVLVQAVESRATALRDPVLRGEALRVRGSMAVQERDLPAAERFFTTAHADAVEARDATLAATTSTDLVEVVGVQLARTAEAELWAAQARAWLRGRSDDDPLQTQLLMVEGNALRVGGRLEEAQVVFTRAVERMESQTNPGDLAEAHRTLGTALIALGKASAAVPHFARELALREARQGLHHPDVGTAHRSLGVALYASGELARALPHLEDAVRILENALGPTHPRLAASLSNLGALRDDLGEPEDAREHFERALGILESTQGPGSTELVGLLGNLAQALRHAGEPEAAAVHLRRAAGLIEAAHGPGHPERVDLLTRLGEVLLEAGSLGEAREVLTQADALRQDLPDEAALISADAARALAQLLHREGEPAKALPLLSEAIERYAALGPMLDPRRGETLLDLGEALLATGDPAAARGPLEAAVPLLTTPKLPAATLARARFALARALVADGAEPGDRARARTLAEDARMGFDEEDRRKREVSAWLEGLDR